MAVIAHDPTQREGEATMATPTGYSIPIAMLYSRARSTWGFI